MGWEGEREGCEEAVLKEGEGDGGQVALLPGSEVYPSRECQEVVEEILREGGREGGRAGGREGGRERDGGREGGREEKEEEGSREAKQRKKHGGWGEGKVPRGR